jgi:5-methylcytosine-specific restriction endonuclease McrA
MKLDKTRAKKRTRLCQMPTPGNIAGRSSSITNAFFNAIIPIDDPSEEEELEALQILGMDRNDIRCAYCGEKSTEWDHLRAIITDQRPTGFITEIANLVPACGKCNQSKGKTEWKKWMVGPAKLSPTTRGVLGIEDRIARLSKYEQWRKPTRIPIEEVISQELWNEHLANWNAVRDLLTKSQKLATEIRQAIERYRLTLETRKASL